jgi:hypothetical protein
VKTVAPLCLFDRASDLSGNRFPLSRASLQAELVMLRIPALRRDFGKIGADISRSRSDDFSR